MLAELFDKMVELSLEARKPRLFSSDVEPDHVYFAIGANGALERRVADPEPRHHSAFSLETVADVVACHKDADPGLPIEVWYSRERVTALLDAATRRDQVTMDVKVTPQLTTLRECELKKQAMPQRSLLRLLRIDLAGCDGVTDLVDSIRLVNFAVGKTTNSDATRGKESVGRTIKAEVAGMKDIPEFVVLQVPVFANVKQSKYPVRCAVEIQSEQETFVFVPLPGEIENALQAAEENLGARLADALTDKASLYFGCP